MGQQEAGRGGFNQLSGKYILSLVPLAALQGLSSIHKIASRF
jgi:hypothetical protein